MDFGIIVDGAVIVVEMSSAAWRRRSMPGSPMSAKKVIEEAAFPSGAADFLSMLIIIIAQHSDLYAAAPRGPHLRSHGVHGGLGVDRVPVAFADTGSTALLPASSP